MKSLNNYSDLPPTTTMWTNQISTQLLNKKDLSKKSPRLILSGRKFDLFVEIAHIKASMLLVLSITPLNPI